MTIKKQPLWIRALASVSCALMVLASAPLKAIDIQALPTDSRSGNGFTHRARILYTDATNSAIYSQWRVFPGVGNGQTGDTIDRAGIYLRSPFFVTNANAGSNAVFLNVGRSDVTNNIFSNFPISSNQTTLAFVTNLVSPISLSAASNFFVASITYSNASMTTNIGQGELYIYLRVVRFDRLSTP